jgi:O-antigen/teichoic acid export membrane protein
MDSPEARSDQPGGWLWRVGGTAVSNGAAKGVLLVGTLLTVPLVLDAIGNEGLGVWLTLVTVTSVLGFADLGLGNGIMTEVAGATTSRSEEKIRSTVAAGYALLVSVAIVMLVVLGASTAFVDLSSLFGLESPDADLSRGITVFLVLFLVGIPLSVTEKLQWGLQRGYVAGVWALASALTTIFGVIAAALLDLGLTGLAIAYAGTPILFGLSNTVWSFAWWRPDLCPRRAHVRRAQMRELWTIGALYFVLQLSAALAFAADNFIVAMTLGPDRVPDLAVPARLFGLVTFALGLLLRPMWPEYTRAISLGRVSWVERTTIRSLVLVTGVAALASAGLLLFGSVLTSALTRGTVTASLALLSALGFTTVVVAAGNALSMLYNAVGAMRFQATVALAMAAVVLILKITLVGPLGVTGVALGGAVGYTMISGTAFAWYTPGVFRRLRADGSAA